MKRDRTSPSWGDQEVKVEKACRISPPPMPCEYSIDPEQRLVRTRLWGSLTDEELIDYQGRLAQDPSFNADFLQLVDGRDISSSKGITAKGIETLARTPLFGAASRRAIVTSSPAVFGLARMLEIHRELSGGKDRIRVFDSLEAATEWLGRQAGGEHED
jgi:hypothetical protein